MQPSVHSLSLLAAAGLVAHAGAQPCATFAPVVPSETRGYNEPTCIAVGDIDNDGWNDLVIANRDSGGRVAIRRGMDSGGYGPDEVITGFTAQSYSNWVDVFDFNDDGNLDLVFGTRYGGHVEIFRGHGDGSFTFHAQFAGIPTTTCVVTADLTGDGRDEIIVTGVGGFQIYKFTDSGMHIYPWQHYNSFLIVYPEVTDIDGDGDLDLVIPKSSTNSVQILSNDGTGTLNPEQSLLLETGSPTCVRALDIDSDGDLDLAVADVEGSVQLFEQSSPGVFESPVAFPAPGNFTDPWYLSVGDLNGDGRPDLVYSAAGSGKIGLFVNRSEPGYITLPPAMLMPVSGYINMQVLDDMDHDGDLDIIAGSWASAFDHPINFIENTTSGVNCYADVSGDGTIDINDLVMVLAEWGKSVSPADINKDFTVNGRDLSVVLNNWGEL